MKISELFMSVLLMSFVAIGMTTFYTGLTESYGISENQIDDFRTTYDKYSEIDSRLKSIQGSIQNTQILNPLTWGNVVSLVINIFSIIFELPELFSGLANDMVVASLFLPMWVVRLVESVILLVIVFGALAAINKWRS